VRIAELERRNAALEQRLLTLEGKLGTNSSNSSVPPSANPLGAPKAVIKKKSKRKRGGQPGHPAPKPRLLPPERVNQVGKKGTG
jgi:transposase